MFGAAHMSQLKTRLLMTGTKRTALHRHSFLTGHTPLLFVILHFYSFLSGLAYSFLTSIRLYIFIGIEFFTPFVAEALHHILLYLVGCCTKKVVEVTYE